MRCLLVISLVVLPALCAQDAPYAPRLPDIYSEEYANSPAPRYLPPENMTADPTDPMYGPWQDAATSLNEWAEWYFKHGVNDIQRQKKARRAIIRLMNSPGWIWCEPMCGEE